MKYLTISVFSLACATAPALAVPPTPATEINLTLSAPPANPGDIVPVTLVADVSTTGMDICALEVVLNWDPAEFTLLGVDTNGAFPWAVSGFLSDPLNSNLPGSGETDGDAVYNALTIVPPAVVNSTGLLVTTFEFQVLQGPPHSPIIFVSSQGMANTAVFLCSPPNTPATLGTTTDVTIQPDCNSSAIADATDIAGDTSTDCNTNAVPDECDITGPTSADCNSNALPDECDLTDGTSMDCNVNAVPDECDLGLTLGQYLDCLMNPTFDGTEIPGATSTDCNHNVVPDECDIAGDTSEDCNSNAVPDECDITGDTSTDCNTNTVPDECGIAGDTSTDCNTNAVPDECDIAGDTSEDCNSNALPDECDIAGDTSADCNSNAIPDECDIAAGTSTDCNSNGAPDTCDLADSTSVDCNGNLVPDECDLGFTFLQFVTYRMDCTFEGMVIVGALSTDCNLNFVPDDCDIAGDTSEDCNSNALPDECDIDGDTSIDCNSNAVPDECDIAGLTSEDCNSNAFPDECDIVEPIQSFCCQNPGECGDDCEIIVGTSQDCNTNGVPDECDIADGTSPDTNLSEVPDECEDPDRVDGGDKGSALFFPFVELVVDPFRSVGGVFADTFITLSNDYPVGPDVTVQMYFISGDTWDFADADITLTPHQPAYWSAWEGRSFGGSGLNFDVLPAVTLPNGRIVVRGAIIAFAVNDDGEEIRWNHLSGEATVVDYATGTAFTYSAYSFAAHKNVPHGMQTGTPGVINLDGFEFEVPPAELLFNFFASGSEALSPVDDLAIVTTETALTLMPASADFTVTDGIPSTPIATLARFVIFNENENKKTNTRKCLTCWSSHLLDAYTSPNWFLLANLGTDMGKASVNGEASFECDIDFDPNDDKELGEDYRDILSEAAALLGVISRHLDFGAGNFDAAGHHLVGRGAESAVIRFPVSAGGGSTDEAPDEESSQEAPGELVPLSTEIELQGEGVLGHDAGIGIR